jgi:TonB family protein
MAAGSSEDASSAGAPSNDKKAESAGSAVPEVPARPVSATPAASVPPGGLLVSQGGKEIFRMPPGQNESSVAAKDGAGSPASGAESGSQTGAVELSPAEAEDRLVQRVEPSYPEQARQQKIQGTVVLVVQIRADGTVEDTEVVKGSPVLVQASMAAVKQWRFKPHVVGKHPVPMTTKVTLNFRLPQ